MLASTSSTSSRTRSAILRTAHLFCASPRFQVVLTNYTTTSSHQQLEVGRTTGKSWFSKVNSDHLMKFLFVSSLSLSSWTFLMLCKMLLLKSRKSNRTRYFLDRVNLHLPGKVSCLSTGLTGSQNNPENCHYLVENISTVEDINKECLPRYPVWLLCWIWWVLACFKTVTTHPSS